MKFRKKPVIIDAVQWHPGIKIKGVKKHKGCEYRMCPVCGGASKDQTITYMPTLEGNMYVQDGDWIITGIKGERYPCKPDIFEKTYEEVK